MCYILKLMSIVYLKDGASLLIEKNTCHSKQGMVDAFQFLQYSDPSCIKVCSYKMALGHSLCILN